MLDEQFKKFWQKQFTLLLLPLPHQPLLATLVETADKLDSVKGFLDPLSNDVPDERAQGMFVAKLAIRYGLRTLEHFGLLDEDADDLPPPANLTQAKNGVANLLTDYRQQIELGRIAAGGPDGGTQAAATRQHGDAEPSKRRSETPDADEANLLVLQHLKQHPQATIKAVSQATGISVGRINGLEAWKRAMAQRKAAKPAAKKSERPLTQKMLESRGQKDDPAEQVMRDEAIWQWLLEQAKPKEKAELHMKTHEQRAKLIELARQQYDDDHAHDD
jgi:hypothetical protein